MYMDDRDHGWDGSQYKESLGDEEVEKEIQALLPAVKKNMEGEYCRVCYELPSKLDVLIASRNVDNIEIAHPLEGIRALEAGCLAGCRLCRLITQRINPQDKLRLLKIENRLKLLSESNALVLSFFLRNCT